MKTHKEFATEIINSGFPINSQGAIDNLAKLIESDRKGHAIEFHVHELKKIFLGIKYSNHHKKNMGVNFDKWITNK